MFISHLRAGTGAVAVETREEDRLIVELLSELDGTAREFAVMSAPMGVIQSIRLIGGKLARDADPLVRPANGQMALAAAYKWAAAAPGRVLVVLDWHMVANAPGHWRLLLESLPGIRQPLGCVVGDPASLVVFVAPTLALETYNPLKGQLTRLDFAPPSREALRATAGSVAELPGGDLEESVVDALCGLSSDTAEQVCAEVVQHGEGWVIDKLLEGKRQALKDSGIELLDPVSTIGGLGRLKSFVEHECVPYLRDDQLAEQRFLLYGLPGCGKSLFARWLAGRLKCLAGCISLASLKAGIVGASEGNLRRCLRAVDAMGKHAPFVLLIDEVDSIATDGLDGGTSSGMFQILLTTLNDWLSQGSNQVIVVGTGNDLSNLSAQLESRFISRWFVDLPTQEERRNIAAIHFERFRCVNVDHASRLLATLTDGYSGREISEDICRSAARLSDRKLDDESVRIAVRRTVAVSTTQPEKLEKMRNAAATLRRANDEDDHSDPSPTRRVMS